MDSWPFEPNVLAAKASVQPNLNQWDESFEEDDEMEDDPDPHWHFDEDSFSKAGPE